MSLTSVSMKNVVICQWFHDLLPCDDQADYRVECLDVCRLHVGPAAIHLLACGYQVNVQRICRSDVRR